MPRPQQSTLQQQMARASRRLFLQTFLGCLLWSWAGALALSAGWFVGQHYLLESPPEWLRLVVAGGTMAVATVLAIVLALYKRPSHLAAALMIDEKFGLKERVTTSLSLEPGQENTPAGQALLADVNQRLADLDMRSKFPVTVSWLAGIMPVAAVILAVAAFYYQPPATHANIPADDKKAEAPPNAVEIEQKLNQLKKKASPRPRDDRPPSEDLKNIEAELDRIANRPRSTKEQLRERIKEMTALEDQAKNKEKEMAERSNSIRHQLQQLDRLGNQDGNREGPARDLQKALAEGNLDQAKDEIQKLAKKLKENQLSNKEKQDLAKQLEDTQKKLERLAEQRDKQEELKKLHKEGKLDADALKRELQNLKEDSDKLKDLQKLASQLGQCRQALQNGSNKEASQGLSDAAEQLSELEGRDQDLQDLREQLQRLQDAKDSC